MAKRRKRIRKSYGKKSRVKVKKTYKVSRGGIQL